MIETKSTLLAMEEAQTLSIEHPGHRYRVMLKPRRKAVVTGSDWVYRERILDGWRCYTSFLDGRIEG